MRKIILFFLLTCISATINAQDIKGKWLFESILSENQENQKNLKPISEGDFMIIKEDGLFEYQLKEIPLYARGSWELKENILSLKYNEPNDTVRSYTIIVSKNNLTLTENGINFSFKKDLPLTTKNSTFSFNSLLRGIIGVISLLLIGFLFSRNRKKINWNLVVKGLAIQFLFAILILKVTFISNGFEFIGKIFTKIISFTQDGTMFLFQSFESGIIESPLMNFVVMI